MKRVLFALLPLLLLASPALAEKKCIVAGCGSDRCVEETSEPLMTDCRARLDTQCYHKYSACEPQADGTCGWTRNEKLDACVKEANGPLPGKLRLTQ